MGLNIFRFHKPENGETAMREVRDLCADEVADALLEFQIRELCFWTCANFVADAIGRCEMRTYVDGTEVKRLEYYMWNIEPNVNQNSTAFWHKAIAKLFEDNETLIIPTRLRDGMDAYVVADAWTDGQHFPSRQNEYQNVTVGDMSYGKTFYEGDVLHLRLNHCNLKPVIDGITHSYMVLVEAAMRAYNWGSGQHWKVHVNQMTSGKEGWLDTFQQILEKQIKPFLSSPSGLLPEFDGYDFVNLSDKSSIKDTRDIKALIEDLFTMTARGFGIPAVLTLGSVESTGDAMRRALTTCVDPICDQISEEFTRKRCGYKLWSQGTYLRMDSSSIEHFDLFGAAANIEKLVGSGWSVNDIRRAAGEETINEPWADEHFITKNFELARALLAAQKGGNE